MVQDTVNKKLPSVCLPRERLLELHWALVAFIPCALNPLTASENRISRTTVRVEVTLRWLSTHTLG